MAEYTDALSKAWSDLSKISPEKGYSLRLLADEYNIDLENRRILSGSAAPKNYISILLLHYLIRRLGGLPQIKGEWISFKQLPGGQGYFPNFKKRVIDIILQKYGARPEGLLKLVERFPAKRARLADISIVLEILERVPVLINFWRGDSEFGPAANILFDQGISAIFCTEDIVVLAEVLAHRI